MLLSSVLNIPESRKITNLLPPIPFLFLYFLQLGLRQALKQCQGRHRSSGDGKVCDPRSSGWDNYHSKSKLVSWAPCLSSGLGCSLKIGWETAVASDTPSTAWGNHAHSDSSVRNVENAVSRAHGLSDVLLMQQAVSQPGDLSMPKYSEFLKLP